MYICYLGESGGCEAPDASQSATPVMVIAGLIVHCGRISTLTRDFLDLKRRHFPGRFAMGPALDHILVEIKGSALLQWTRSESRNLRRQAQRFRRELLDLLDEHGCRLVGRVWVKRPQRGMDPAASYCYAIQDIARHFAQFLIDRNAVGVIIADARTHQANIRVAHSIFTQKWSIGGDRYHSLREVPLFAASDNHAGLQIVDLVASTLIFPMATAAYCPHVAARNPHSSPRYAEIRTAFGLRLRDLQYRYRDGTGWWRGGLVVSDPVGRRPGAYLFGPPEAGRPGPGDPLGEPSPSSSMTVG